MRRSVILAAFLLAAPSIEPARSGNYSTPQGVVAAFDDAYDRHDIDGLVAARDLMFEAREHLGRARASAPDEETARETAKTLESEYRDRIRRLGFFERNLRACQYVTTLTVGEAHVRVVEACRSPGDGDISGTMFPAYEVIRSEDGWRIALPTPPAPAKTP